MAESAAGRAGNSAEHSRRAPARGAERQALEDARDLLAALRAAGEEWSGALRSNLRRRPYASLGIAAGVGYVLAGGLAPSVLRLALGTGWRVVAAALLRELLEAARDAPPARHE